ncbi:ROK family protein [Paenibacillus psychroresistens]|uniref:ROK family protein n=1 Tax=Paenibacillus psychroresistens TaxID=1778678 RepID=A0A6B8RPQ7_9BACL|nr:ROK family protein [Paenibacillus psychroresistens]QGQ97515.1 ROK family protein [Paenibacillus psychroresistens]
MSTIGIDLGGTKIKAGIIGKNGEIGQTIQVMTPIELGRDGIMSALSFVIDRLLETLPTAADGNVSIRAIGIGSAGRVHRETGTITFATDNLPGWTGTKVKELLERKHGFPVFVENDVKAAALGESWLGAAREWRHFAFIALGTGIGGALVYGGNVISGPNDGPEIGHIMLHPGGAACNCGQNGCLEQYVSGKALNRVAREVDVLWDSRKLIRMFVEKDARATNVMRKFIHDLCAGLITIQNAFDPQTIVLGGGVMDSYPFWQEHFITALHAATSVDIRVIPALLGNDAGMLGAAKLAWNEIVARDGSSLDVW